jgi:hypothetical protein
MQALPRRLGSVLFLSLLLLADGFSGRIAAAAEDVEVRAYVNDACIIADEPFYVPQTGREIERAFPLGLIIVGKLAELLVNHVIKAAAGRINARGARQDTRYAVVRQMNLYRVDLRPAPTLKLNAQLGCMTIVAGKFQPDAADCRSAYLPREVSSDTAALDPAQWRTSRTDNSLQNLLRRANVCTDGEPRAVYEARFEFSPDGTAYRLKNAGYRIQTLLSTTDKSATRSAFYTLEIAEPGESDKKEVLSTAWINLGMVKAGEEVHEAKGNPAPWLRVPALSVEARRAYEEQTKTQQDVAAEIDAVKRAITRNQRMQAALQRRLPELSGDVLAGVKQEIAKTEVQNVTLQAELEARTAEYNDLPQAPLEFMPVAIEVGVTESVSEKKALLALGEVIDSNISGVVASAANNAVVARSFDLAAPTSADPLQSTRARYFDALLAVQNSSDSDADQARDELTLAKAQYNTARGALGLEAVD